MSVAVAEPTRRYSGDLAWKRFGNCRDVDPNVFFPSDVAGVNAAKQICRSCPALNACLRYALANAIPYGIWGGTSERQRRSMRRKSDAA